MNKFVSVWTANFFNVFQEFLETIGQVFSNSRTTSMTNSEAFWYSMSTSKVPNPRPWITMWHENEFQKARPSKFWNTPRIEKSSKIVQCESVQWRNVSCIMNFSRFEIYFRIIALINRKHYVQSMQRYKGVGWYYGSSSTFHELHTDKNS